jgi:membrane peptidoglycan carboxypeptidase
LNSREKSLLYRRNLILGRLASVGYLSAEEYSRAKPVALFQKIEEAAPLLPQED